MRIKDLDPQILSEMDKSQKGPAGWNIDDDEPGAKEHYVKAAKPKDVIKSATKSLNKEMGKAHKKVKENRYGSRDAYQRDYDSSQTGFGRGHDHRGLEHELAHETNNYGVSINGKMWKVFGSRQEANRVSNAMERKYPDKKIGVHATGAPVSESATAGATSTGSIGTVVSPQLSPGSARGKRSYTGSPSTGSGTKAPPQPKVVQPKKSDGTAVNGLDIKGKAGNLFGSPTKESAVIKRR